MKKCQSPKTLRLYGEQHTNAAASASEGWCECLDKLTWGFTVRNRKKLHL